MEEASGPSAHRCHLHDRHCATCSCRGRLELCIHQSRSSGYIRGQHRIEAHRNRRSIDRDRKLFGSTASSAREPETRQCSAERFEDSSREINAVRASLASAKNEVAGFWPSSFEIITLLSKASSTEIDFAKLENARESVFDNVGANRIGAISPVTGVRAVLKNDVHGMVFRNSIIRFDLSVKLSNDVFVDCIFIFPPEQNPTGPLQQIGRTLLASNLENVTLNAS